MPTGHFPRDWTKRRQTVMQRDEGRCQIKGPGCLYWATEVDHIVPRSVGDKATMHHLDNLRAVCRPCHLARGRKAAPSVARWTKRLTRPI